MQCCVTRAGLHATGHNQQPAVLCCSVMQSMRRCWCGPGPQQQHKPQHAGWMPLRWNLWCHPGQSSRRPTSCCRSVDQLQVCSFALSVSCSSPNGLVSAAITCWLTAWQLAADITVSGSRCGILVPGLRLTSDSAAALNAVRCAVCAVVAACLPS